MSKVKAEKEIEERPVKEVMAIELNDEGLSDALLRTFQGKKLGQKVIAITNTKQTA